MYIYSFLAGGEESGHLILDDSYWLKYFDKSVEGIYTSSYSVGIQKSKFPTLITKLFVIDNYIFFQRRISILNSILRCTLVKLPRHSNILIQGFEEIPILFFLIRARFYRNKIFLVLTNNICDNRVNEERILTRWLLKQIFKLSNRVLYHTEYELQLINRFITSTNNNKFKYVKYHLLANTRKSESVTQKKIRNKKVITFFGPVKIDKPLEPFIQLMKEDKESLFVYRIYNPGFLGFNELNKLISKFPSLEIIDRFISYEEYDAAVLDSDYIFLSHNQMYSGKLSGNLCDCISKRIPFISDNISPVKELITYYGKIGYVFDFSSNENWANQFLKSVLLDTYQDILNRLEAMQNDFTDEVIERDLNSIFS